MHIRACGIWWRCTAGSHSGVADHFRLWYLGYKLCVVALLARCFIAHITRGLLPAPMFIAGILYVCLNMCIVTRGLHGSCNVFAHNRTVTHHICGMCLVWMRLSVCFPPLGVHVFCYPIG